MNHVSQSLYYSISEYYDEHELNWNNVHYNSEYSNYYELNWNNVHYNSEYSNYHDSCQ